MTLPSRSSLLLFAVYAVATIGGLRAEPGRVFPAVTPAQIASIEAALPKQTVAPAQPRRVLVFYRTEGFVHSSIPVGMLALKRLGETTGAFTAIASDDMAQFEPATLAGFDVIVFLNSTGLKFETPAHRQALLDFVRRGKGIVGIHAATDNFPTWPEGQALMGGVFHGHPWNANDLSAFKIDEPAHVLTQSFEGKGFWLREEIYQFKAPYSRERQRVLLSLDMSKPENARPAEKIKRTDNDFAVSWLRAEGKGRVFYTSLGHREDVYFTPAVLSHMLAGLRYALGDLAADDVPSVKATPVAPALAPEDRTTLQERSAKPSPTAASPATAKKAPTTSAPLAVLSPAERADREIALLATLNEPTTSIEGKLTSLDALNLVGTVKSVPTLARLAASTEPGVPERAAHVLARLRLPAAEAALLSLSESLPSSGRVAVINALVSYPSPQTISRLKTIAEANTEDARASRASLSGMATAESVTALFKLPANSDNTQAVLASADLLLRRDANAAKGVANVVRQILSRKMTVSERVEALSLLARIGSVQDGKVFTAALDSTEPRVRQTAVAALVARRDSAAIQALVTRWASLPDDTQLAALSAIRDGSGSPLIRLGLASANETIAASAINAASRIGDLDMLFGQIARLKDKGKGAARTALVLALAQTPSQELSVRLMDMAGTERDPALQAALISLLGDRKLRESLPIIQTASVSADDAPRAAAFKALSDITGPRDLSVIISIAPNIKKSADRRDWRKALYGAIDGNPEPRLISKLLIDALANPALPERSSFIGALTLLDTPEAIATLNTMLSAPEAAARKDVIRALSSARTTGSLKLLQQTASASIAPDEKILSVRGCIETITSFEIMRPADRVARYREVWPLAERTEEKDAILAAVRELKGKDAEKFVKEFAPEPAPEPAPVPAPAESETAA